MEWIQSNWALIVAAVTVLLALAKIVNKATKHFTEFNGWRRWILAVVDLMDLIKRTPAPK